jgi:hypothetical protein
MARRICPDCISFRDETKVPLSIKGLRNQSIDTA